MKKIMIGFTIFNIITLIAIWSTYPHWANPSTDEQTPEVTATEVYTFDDMLDVIEEEESKGIATARGDFVDGKPRAIGAYQLHEIYVEDYYRIIGEKPLMLTDYDFRLSKIWSRRITKTVTQHYAHAAYPELEINDIQFLEAAARVHNGGGDGWRNDPDWFVRNHGYTLDEAKKKIATTDAYWNKVKQRLEQGK